MDTTFRSNHAQLRGAARTLLVVFQQGIQVTQSRPSRFCPVALLAFIGGIHTQEGARRLHLTLPTRVHGHTSLKEDEEDWFPLIRAQKELQTTSLPPSPPFIS